MEQNENEKRKTELRDAAEKLFRRKGIMATTVNSIAREVHVAKGLFYYYYSSKEELIAAVSRKYCDRFTASLQQKNEQDDNKREVLAFLQSAGISFRDLWMNLQGENETIDLTILASQTMDEAKETAARMLKERLEKGRMENTFHIRNVDLWAKWLIGGIADLAADPSVSSDELNYMINDLIDRL